MHFKWPLFAIAVKALVVISGGRLLLFSVLPLTSKVTFGVTPFYTRHTFQRCDGGWNATEKIEAHLNIRIHSFPVAFPRVTD